MTELREKVAGAVLQMASEREALLGSKPLMTLIVTGDSWAEIEENIKLVRKMFQRPESPIPGAGREDGGCDFDYCDPEGDWAKSKSRQALSGEVE